MRGRSRSGYSDGANGLSAVFQKFLCSWAALLAALFVAPPPRYLRYRVRRRASMAAKVARPTTISVASIHRRRPGHAPEPLRLFESYAQQLLKDGTKCSLSQVPLRFGGALGRPLRWWTLAPASRPRPQTRGVAARAGIGRCARSRPIPSTIAPISRGYSQGPRSRGRVPAVAACHAARRAGCVAP